MESVYNFVACNGQIKEKDELAFPFLDYGFLYGYGLFESIKVENSKPLLLSQHYKRIRRGAIILEIPFEYEEDSVRTIVTELIDKNKVVDGILNFYLTPGDRAEDPAEMVIKDPFFLIINRKWPNYSQHYAATLELRQESFQKTPLDRFKTLSWVKNILETRFNTKSDDVLLYNRENYVLETSRANVFFIKGDMLFTPKSSVILPGVTRQFIIDNQDEFGMNVLETSISADHLEEFDEIFLTNALRGIFCVSELERYPQLSSKLKTKQLQETFQKLIQKTV